MALDTYFSGDYIDRSAALRRDAAGAGQLHSIHPDTRFLPVWEAHCLIRDGAAPA